MYTNFRNMLNESGYARVRRILFGDVPNINTVGIITAENPQGNKISKKENEERNRKLKDHLQSGNYGPVKIRGMFGYRENPFLVKNITREELVKLGKMYDQEAVIWGEKNMDKNDNPYFRFEYIEGDKTASVRTVHIGNEEVRDRPDYYTMVKGRKFVIPFFDDPNARKVPGHKYGTLISVPDSPATPWSDDELADKIKKVETFYLPFFDDPASTNLIFDESWGITELTYYSSKLPKTPEIKQIIDEVHKRTEMLFEKNRTGKSCWANRGVIWECLRKLNLYAND